MHRTAWFAVRLALVAFAASCVPGCGRSADLDAASGADRAAPPVWRLEPAPVYSIAEGTEPREFQLHIAEAGLLLPNGDAVIANMGANELVFIDSIGRAKHIVGRKGSGPGEFRALGRPVHAGDRVAAWNVRLNRATFYSVDAEYLGDQPLPRGRSLALLGVTPDGEAVGTPLSARADVPRRQIVFWDSRGQVMREVPGLADPPPTEITYRVPGPSGPVGVNWDVLGGRCLPVVRYTMVGGTVYGVHTGTATVFAIDASGAHREIFRDPERGTITSRMIDEIKRLMHGDGKAPAPPDAVEAMLARIGEVGSPIPSKWSEVRPDPAGRLWLRVADCAARPELHEWQVIDTTGVLVAKALVPSALDVLAVRGSRLLARRRDELDVEHVELYRIVGPGVNEAQGS